MNCDSVTEKVNYSFVKGFPKGGVRARVQIIINIALPLGSGSAALICDSMAGSQCL